MGLLSAEGMRYVSSLQQPLADEAISSHSERELQGFPQEVQAVWSAAYPDLFPQAEASSSFDKETIEHYRERTFSYLQDHVTSKLIYASSNTGHFFRPYVRDSTLIETLLTTASEINPDSKELKKLSADAVSAEMRLWDFQLKNGALPHEIVPESLSHDERTQGLIDSKFFVEIPAPKGDTEKCYFVNPESVDATPLLVMRTLTRLNKARGTQEWIDNNYDALLPKLQKAIQYMTTNVLNEDHTGFYSYWHDDNKKQGTGLYTQNLKDSQSGLHLAASRCTSEELKLIEELKEAEKAKDKERIMAIKSELIYVLPQGVWMAPVEVQTYARTAFLMAKEFFGDREELGEVDKAVASLEKNFAWYYQQDEQGNTFLASSIWVRDNEIFNINHAKTSEQGFALFGDDLKNPMIQFKVAEQIINTMLLSEEEGGLFNKDRGMATHTPGDGSPTGDYYHVSDRKDIQIYWGVISGIIATDLLRRGYALDKAKAMLEGVMRVVHKVDSFAEQVNNMYERFRQGQKDQSCKDQTWTAATYALALAYLDVSTVNRPETSTQENLVYRYIPNKPIPNVPLAA